ncbi:MAG: ABC transporter ATP-binding protein [Clostridiales bacterium]|nr:ABC transporter ATP-binding protein [Clostridiales bacterium]
MHKIAKYMKPYIGLIIGAILLLFVQAMCDLALPDYMSNIVNVGLQQGGIEDAVPKALTETKMNKILLFMTEDEKKLLSDSYTKIDQSSSDYNDYLDKYPILSKESVYVLKNQDDENKEKLNSAMSKALLVTYGIDQMQESALKEGKDIEIQGNKIPAGTDLFAILGKMPEEQRITMAEESVKQYSALGENTIVQAATSAVKVEYKVLGMDTDKIQNRYILKMGVFMLLISLLSAVAIVIVGFLSSRTAAGFARDLRGQVFKKVQRFSNTEIDKFSTASLITRTTNDITQLQMLIVIMIRMVFYAPIIGVGGVIRAIGKSASMSWIIALAVALILVLIAVIIVVAVPKFKIIQKLVDRLNLVARENLSGIMVIRAFNTEKFEEKRFDKANSDVTKNNLFVNRLMSVMMPAMTIIMNGVSLLIVWVGAHEIEKSSMQVGDMMAFMQYAIQILIAFMMMSAMFIMVPRASVAAQRVSEILETEEVIKEPKTSKKFDESKKGVVEFRNVSFRYPEAEEDVIKNISFTARPGQTTAIIGATGSGKTTLINLIPRFYDATEGQVLVDGVDVRDVTTHDLREKIGYVPQKAFLFSGTIDSNLRYGKEKASEEEIEKAAEIAQASEFIKGKEEGFKTEVAQGGGNLSGGQKQRLSIARALAKKPDIYIFDDSFSALDFKTDAALRKALKENTASSTVIIVAQRISTIKNAEQIIVLDEGKVVGIGTHDELMKNCETYREIALSQLSKEELA